MGVAACPVIRTCSGLGHMAGTMDDEPVELTHLRA